MWKIASRFIHILNMVFHNQLKKIPVFTAFFDFFPQM